MRIYDIILKKREGLELNREEITFWVDGYVKGEIPDYQIASLLMAIYFKGLSENETSYLTEVMMNSGDRVNLQNIPGIKADKHSTGGVGDKTSLVLAPIIAAAGIKVAKMSGRGLGHTGGTIDKLESIPEMKVNLSPEEFIENLQNIGIAMVGQSANLVPADKKLYALRDVTATVDSIPLIASSIMSKKLAIDSDVIVLDVKYGSGAFMKSLESAIELSKTMVKIAKNMGRKAAAIISDMDKPLGAAVGNALEVREAINTLKGKGPEDFRELCITLAAQTVYLAGQVSSIEDGKILASDLLDNGAALKKFQDFISAQGGDPGIVDDESILPQAQYRLTVLSNKSGYVSSIDTKSIGIAGMKLGAGRITKEDVIDPAVGIMIHKKTGDWVDKGETLAMIHANDENIVDEAKKLLLETIVIDDIKPKVTPLIYGTVNSRGQWIENNEK